MSKDLLLKHEGLDSFPSTHTEGGCSVHSSSMEGVQKIDISPEWGSVQLETLPQKQDGE